jgi:hypothetical protein
MSLRMCKLQTLEAVMSLKNKIVPFRFLSEAAGSVQRCRIRWPLIAGSRLLPLQGLPHLPVYSLGYEIVPPGRQSQNLPIKGKASLPFA